MRIKSILGLILGLGFCIIGCIFGVASYKVMMATDSFASMEKDTSNDVNMSRIAIWIYFGLIFVLTGGVLTISFLLNSIAFSVIGIILICKNYYTRVLTRKVYFKIKGD